MAGGCGPGQALAKPIELEELLSRRGCSVTIRWNPAHEGVKGKEVAVSYTKWAADLAGREYMREASFTHLTPRDDGGQIPTHERANSRPR